MLGGVKEGLEGVVLTESSISVIDGRKGTLKYRGFDINDLAKNSNFEEICFLLWFRRLPKKEELKKFTHELRSKRKLDASIIPILKKGIKNMTSMDALRTIASYLGQIDPDLNSTNSKANIKKAISLTAKFPTIIAYYYRISQNKKPIPPKSNLSHGANFLYMLTGKVPKKLQEHVMELDFLLTAEHGMNASTFATRVATSTLTDLHSAIIAGICTLKGPLHGAAREKVYEMLEEIKTPAHVHQYIFSKINKHEKIMGFGHRVYKTTDPRAVIFKYFTQKLGENAKNMNWYNIVDKMDQLMMTEFVKKRKKPLYPNVDFYTGAIYKYLKIPKELSTGIFAIGRIAGWIAHFEEQMANNRLIRPTLKYVGAKNEKYVPIEKRK